MPSSSRFTRRRFIEASAATVAATAALPRVGHASPGGDDLKFLFVVNYGGWDPLTVFATEFNNPAVDMAFDTEGMDEQSRQMLDQMQQSFQQMPIVFPEQPIGLGNEVGLPLFQV